MIDIDEATKGIMNDLQTSLASNIEGGVTAGLRRLSEDSQNQFTTLQSVLSSQLSTLEEVLANSQKPMSRLSRDVVDVLDLLSKVKSSVDSKFEKVEQIQENTIQAINEKVDTIFNRAIEKQQASADESMKEFINETKKANNVLAEEVTVIKQSFEDMTTVVTTKLEIQFNALQQQQEELAKRAAELQSIKVLFEQVIESQKAQFDSMKQVLLEVSMTALSAQQNSFEEQLQTLAENREQLVKVLKDAQKEQLQSIQREQCEIVNRVVAEAEITREQLAKEITNPVPFDLVQQSIAEIEGTLLSSLNQQPILKKLEEVQKELEYVNLPFYKKWFVKKES